MTETVTQQVASISERQENIKNLAEEKNQIDNRGEEIESKNRAFRELKSALDETRSDYETLIKWRRLADEIGVEYDANAIDSVKTQLNQELQKIVEREFDDFANASEIRDLKGKVDEYCSNLKNQQRKIRRTVEETCAELLKEVDTKRTVLRIPDIGTTEDEQKIEAFRAFLIDIENGNVHQDTAEQYRAAADAYEKVQISFDTVQEDYGLSDATMEELRKFLNNEAVTLAEINEATLGELKDLPKFSDLLTIQFKGGE